jgi:hypothetical protein
MKLSVLILVLVLTVPVVVSQTVLLQTQRQAASNTAERLKSTGYTPTLEEIEAGVDVARQAEITAIRNGHPEKVAPADTEDCRKVMAKQDADAWTARQKAVTDAEIAASDAAAAAAAEKERKVEAKNDRADLLKHHCPAAVHIGTSVTCVYLILGYPDHTNVDARSGKQLVYPDDTYVYINLRGFVEDFQSRE